MDENWVANTEWLKKAGIESYKQDLNKSPVKNMYRVMYGKKLLHTTILQWCISFIKVILNYLTLTDVYNYN